MHFMRFSCFIQEIWESYRRAGDLEEFVYNAM